MCNYIAKKKGYSIYQTKYFSWAFYIKRNQSTQYEAERPGESSR